MVLTQKVSDMFIPVVSFVGYSSSGKTSLIEKVVPKLKKHGLKVAVIKHAAHGFDVDKPGKDSWRFGEAGSDIVVLTAPGQVMISEKTPGQPDLEAIINSVRGKVNLVLVEGYKSAKLPKVEVRSSIDSPGLPCSEEDLIAIIHGESVPGRPPQFNPQDVDALARRLGEMAARELI